VRTTAIAVTIALLSFLLGNVWVFVSAGMFVRYFYEARMVALTHVFTLGWVSLMIVGVLRQLGPVAFGLKFKRTGLFSAVVALWIPGLILLVVGFATLRYTIAGIGASLVVVAVVGLVGFCCFAFRGVNRELPHDHLIAALLYLCAAAVLGAWMGLSKAFDLPLFAPFHQVLFAHTHLAGAGWAGMTILAVLSRLFPQPHLRNPHQARLRFAAFNAGLVGLAAGFLVDGGWHSFFGSILAVACIWYAIAFVPVLQEFSQPADRSTGFLVTAWISLAIVAIIGLSLLAVFKEPTAFTMQLQFVYGFLYMFGWLSLMILGMLYRIIPTHISKFLGSRGVAAAGLRRAFVDPRLQIAVLACLQLALFVAGIGILRQSLLVFRLGWAIWLTGVLVFFAGLVRLGAELRGILAAKSHSRPRAFDPADNGLRD
jgi:hypothetical protein